MLQVQWFHDPDSHRIYWALLVIGMDLAKIGPILVKKIVERFWYNSFVISDRTIIKHELKTEWLAFGACYSYPW